MADILDLNYKLILRYHTYLEVINIRWQVLKFFALFLTLAQ